MPMSKLLQGKTAIVLGVWNKWSIAYAIAQAFSREGAKLLLTYKNERAKTAVEELGRELGAAGHYPAIDILQSVSRLAPRLCTPEQKEAAIKVREALATHEQ